MKKMFFAATVSVAAYAFAQERDLAKWDPDMAIKNAVVDTNGVKWIDGKFLPLEGRMFFDVEHYYDRLPANVTTNVNIGVRHMKHDTAGMLFRFVSDSKTLRFRWIPYNTKCYMDHMPATGHSGIDVYRYSAEKKAWMYVTTGRPKRNGANLVESGSLVVPWTPGTPCLVNLPLYNGVREFSLGIDNETSIKAMPPRASGINKPVVFYGTSITHGGCCSRPGLSFVNRIGRDLDVPVVNLGFSGSGRMELEMADHLARIDASCYVLDCLWNMSSPRQGADAAFQDMESAGYDKKDPISVVRFRYEPFIRALRAKRPKVPIVMAEQRDVFMRGTSVKDRFVRKLYDKLVAEGWKDLVYLPKDEMYTGDLEGTVDGCHPNDLGMESMAKAFGVAVRKALKLKRR